MHTHIHTYTHTELHEAETGQVEDASTSHALRGQLIEMEHAMWDSGAHVRMQRLMNEFHKKVGAVRRGWCVVGCGWLAGCGFGSVCVCVWVWVWHWGECE